MAYDETWSNFWNEWRLRSIEEDRKASEAFYQLQMETNNRLRALGKLESDWLDEIASLHDEIDADMAERHTR